MSEHTVGFIGVGRMGSRMARNLLRAGFTVRAYDLSQPALESIVEAGAAAASSCADVAASCDVIVTVLQSGEAVESALLDDRGVVAGLRPGAAILEMSTISPTLARRLAAVVEERGGYYLDCPVSGGPPGAERGTLTIMAGGDAEVFERWRGVIQPMAGAIHYLGPVGSGLIGKLINQLLVMSQTVLAVEALAVGARAGMDLNTLFDLVGKSSGNSWAWQNRVPRFLHRPEDIWATVDICHKDLGLATSLGREVGVPLFVGESAFQVLQMAKARGLGQKDLASLAAMYEEMLGASLRAPAIAEE